MSDETKALIWYLAYGSNMNRGIFESRRGMRPIQAQPALLENYRLRFNLAVGPGERGVANLESQAGARTWGVLYLITVEQCEHLDRTEGVPRGAYRRIPVSDIVDGVNRSGVHLSVREDRPWAKANSKPLNTGAQYGVSVLHLIPRRADVRYI